MARNEGSSRSMNAASGLNKEPNAIKIKSEDSDLEIKAANEAKSTEAANSRNTDQNSTPLREASRTQESRRFTEAVGNFKQEQLERLDKALLAVGFTDAVVPSWTEVNGKPKVALVAPLFCALEAAQKKADEAETRASVAEKNVEELSEEVKGIKDTPGYHLQIDVPLLQSKRSSATNALSKSDTRSRKRPRTHATSPGSSTSLKPFHYVDMHREPVPEVLDRSTLDRIKSSAVRQKAFASSTSKARKRSPAHVEPEYHITVEESFKEKYRLAWHRTDYAYEVIESYESEDLRDISRETPATNPEAAKNQATVNLKQLGHYEAVLKARKEMEQKHVFEMLPLMKQGHKNAGPVPDEGGYGSDWTQTY